MLTRLIALCSIQPFKTQVIKRSLYLLRHKGVVRLENLQQSYSKDAGNSSSNIPNYEKYGDTKFPANANRKSRKDLWLYGNHLSCIDKKDAVSLVLGP